MKTQMLTQKQEAFCLAYINSANASEAYRQAYGCGKWKPESVNRKAFDMLQDVKIVARIAELRKVAADKAGYTLAEHMKRLKLLSERAEDENQLAAAIKAEELRGKVSGFYTDNVSLTNPDGSLRPTMIKIVAKR